MFCPRCGRPVNPTANFCGGCGLPRAEIEKAVQPQVQAPVQPETPAVDINELNTTLSQLEGDLAGINPVENYTTDTATNTNTEMAPQADIVEEIRLSVESLIEDPQPVQPDPEDPVAGYQSQYSRNAPQHPYYNSSATTQAQPVQQPEPQPEHTMEQPLTTVEFVWMLLISSIPVVGVIYVIYQAFVQQESATKRSWARATMIVFLFSFILGLVFALGVAIPQFMYWG